jgi:hypothetical protein
MYVLSCCHVVVTRFETFRNYSYVIAIYQAGADVDQATKSGQLCSQLTSNRYTQKVLRRLRKKQKGHLYRNANENDELLFSDFRGAMNNFMSSDTKSKQEKVEDDSAGEL